MDGNRIAGSTTDFELPLSSPSVRMFSVSLVLGGFRVSILSARGYVLVAQPVCLQQLISCYRGRPNSMWPNDLCSVLLSREIQYLSNMVNVQMHGEAHVVIVLAPVPPAKA